MPAERHQFSVDNRGRVPLLGRMSQSEKKLTSPASLALDAVLVIGFNSEAKIEIGRAHV